MKVKVRGTNLEGALRLFKRKTKEENLLNDFNVPASKIRTLPEVLSEEQFLENYVKENGKFIGF